ncbi:MAG: NAD-dependent epimerase/dehydratase [Cytophagales bacterium]|nr:NAD-dependent epimerase/dehydratase [Cytophagales bacterium]
MKKAVIVGHTGQDGTYLCQLLEKKGYNIFVCIGIFYNHESPLRESKYVSKKIVETAIAIKNNAKGELKLGDLDSRIDWGYAPDYVDAVFGIMQLTEPDDFIISSGNTHSVKDFVEGVFQYLGMDWQEHVKIDSNLITKKQKRNLFGNNQKIKAITGWYPSISFGGMIKILVDKELKKHASK